MKPSDLDARFGMGVGALFAVAASAFVVSASLPDSASLTVADKMHMVALGFIFLTLLLSAFCLRLNLETAVGHSEPSVAPALARAGAGRAHSPHG